MQLKNRSNKVAIKLWVVQFWPEIIRVISNRDTVLKSDQTAALHTVQLPFNINFKSLNIVDNAMAPHP